MRFRNRREAGVLLAKRLSALSSEEPVIIALPRGGVPVAFEVARALAAPLDIAVIRKLGAPGNPELGVGALAEDGMCLLNRALLDALGVRTSELGTTIERETEELRRRVQRYRGDRAATSVEGKTVIVIDDGVATGITAVAAARLMHQRRARRVVLAAPVCAPDTVERLRIEFDEVVCLTEPRHLLGIGAWYEDFAQVSDDQVLSLLALARQQETGEPREVEVVAGRVRLPAHVNVPAASAGLVIFAHGSGSSRLSPRNMAVARRLNDVGLATLLFDLLTPLEATDVAKVFDVRLLATRLVRATDWAAAQRELGGLPVGYFGASTGAAAALWAAARLGNRVAAVVSRGGRPDLAATRLAAVAAPTLLIVGSEDRTVLDRNRRALEQLRCHRSLEVIPGAGHLFEEPGALDRAADLAAEWFLRFCGVGAGRRPVAEDRRAG